MIKPPECVGCPLFYVSNGFLMPDGKGTSGVVIVGEAAGYEEYLDGLPFRPQAQAGSKLEEAFSIVGTSRPNFKLYNVLQCQPPNNLLVGMQYEQGAIAHCKVHRDREIGGYQTPHKKVILGLGNTALKVLTGISGDGANKESITHLRGYVLDSTYGPFVGSLHPSYLRRGKPNLTPFLAADISKALRIARGQYTTYKGGKDYVEPTLVTHPSLDDAYSFYNYCRDNPRLPITYDIETPLIAGLEEDERALEGNVEITLVQFAISKTFGIAFPYIAPFVEVAHKILALPNPKAGHNCWDFDNPILYSKGVVINGHIHDTLWMFKTWQPTLERGLQKVASLFDFPYPWKHLYGAQLEYYGCTDVIADYYLLEELPKLMRKDGTWECYKRHVFELYTTCLLPASKRGIPVSKVRWEALKVEIEGERSKLQVELNGLIPEALRNVHPVEGYKREPKEITALRENYIAAARALIGKGIRPKITFPKLAQERFGLVRRKFNLEGDGIVERWCKIKPFLAGSSDQVKRYLRWKQEHTTVELARYYEVPKTLAKKGEEVRETTGGDELEWLLEKTGDKVIELVLKDRSLGVTVNNMIPNWEPGPDGRVHCSWNFKAPTGQLSTTGPNIQNASKHTIEGQRFRRIIEAEEGWEFSELDYKAFHVAVMGYIADDPDYIRFSQIDPHSILGSVIMKDDGVGVVSLKAMNNEQIKAICKKFKGKYAEVRQNVCKPAVLGNQLGLGYKKLHHQNRKYIETEQKAQYLQAMLARLFPKVEVAKDRIMKLAHMQRELKNPWGRRQAFFDVYLRKYSSKSGWYQTTGTDAEKALAFVVQSCAFGMIAEKILECARRGYNETFGWINTIHDSSMFLYSVGARDSFVDCVKPIYQSPCEWLKAVACPNGLQVAVEHSVGRNWANYNELDNPEGMREI